MNEHETHDGPNEGHNRFYDQSIPADKIAGLEYAIKRTKERIVNDPSRPEGVFEEHLKGLERDLVKAKEESK